MRSDWRADRSRLLDNKEPCYVLREKKMKEKAERLKLRFVIATLIASAAIPFGISALATTGEQIPRRSLSRISSQQKRCPQMFA